MNIDIKILQDIAIYIWQNGWYIVLMSLAIGFNIKWTPGLRLISDFIPVINSGVAAIITLSFHPFPDLDMPAQITLSILLALLTSPFYDKVIKPFETHIISFLQKWLAKLLGIQNVDKEDK